MTNTLTPPESDFLQKAFEITQHFYRSIEKAHPGTLQNNVTLAFHEATLPLYLENALQDRNVGYLSLGDILDLISPIPELSAEPGTPYAREIYLDQIAGLLLTSEEVEIWRGLQLLADLAPPPFCFYAKEVLKAPATSLIRDSNGSGAQSEKILAAIDRQWATDRQSRYLEQKLFHTLIIDVASQELPVQTIASYGHIMKQLAEDMSHNETVLPTRLNLAVAASGVDPSITAHLLMPWLQELLDSSTIVPDLSVTAADVSEAQEAFVNVGLPKYKPYGYQPPIVEAKVFQLIADLLTEQDQSCLLKYYEPDELLMQTLHSSSCGLWLFIALRSNVKEIQNHIKSLAAYFVNSVEVYSDCLDATFTNWGNDSPTYEWWAKTLLQHTDRDTTLKVLEKIRAILQQGFNDRDAYPAAGNYTYSEGLDNEGMERAVTEELHRLEQQYQKGMLQELDKQIRIAMKAPSEDHFRAVEAAYYPVKQGLEDTTIELATLTQPERELIQHAENYVQFFDRIRQITGVSGTSTPADLRAQIVFLMEQLSYVHTVPTESSEEISELSLESDPQLHSFVMIRKFELRMQTLLRRFLEKDPANKKKAVEGIVEGWGKLNFPSKFDDDAKARLLKAPYLENTMTIMNWVCILASKSLQKEFFRPRSELDREQLVGLPGLVKDRNAVGHNKIWNLEDAKLLNLQLDKILGRLMD